MYRFACQRNLVSGSILWLSSATLTLNAQSTDTYSSDALREQYIKELEKASIYSSAPITHLSPSRNRISYALGVDLPNYTMTPDTEDPDYIEYPGVSSSLELTGWSVTPHFSLSLKNIGLGFSVGRGERKLLYTYDVPTFSKTVQESRLAYGDVGLNLYFVPFSKISKRIRATMILGGRSINAKHTISPNQITYTDGNVQDSESKVYRYNINELNGGLNIRFSLLRRFAIIPWADYRYMDTRAIEDTAESEKPSSTAEILADDIQIFWHDRPKFRYGIDFSVQLFQLEFNIGGLLGAVANSGQGKESIEDSSLTVSVSFHQKGN